MTTRLFCFFVEITSANFFLNFENPRIEKKYVDAGAEENFLTSSKDVDVPSVPQQKGGIFMDHTFLRLIVQPW